MTWSSSWLVEQEVRAPIPGLAATISEIGYLLLPNRDMAEIPLKRHKSSKQLTSQPKFSISYLSVIIYLLYIF